jgi:hypothetical protein
MHCAPELRNRGYKNINSIMQNAIYQLQVQLYAHPADLLVKPPKSSTSSSAAGDNHVYILFIGVIGSCLLHLVQDGASELMGRGVASHIARAGLAVRDNLVDGLRDAVCVVVKTDVSQHHSSGQDKSGGVSLVLTLDVETDVTASRLEDGDVTAHVASRDNTRSTDQTSANVGQDTSVQVRHHHDVELLWPRDALHGGVVDDHVVGLDRRVVLADLLDGVAEQTVGKLHDVGLVDAGNLLAIVGERKGKGELGNALRLLARNDLEGLDDSIDRLVLETGVLALGVLTDDAEINVLVARLVARDVLEQDNGSVDIQFLTEGDVEGTVAGSLDGSV